jgi:hypothetical protein
MRLPRMTMRRWMIVVAVVGIVLGLTIERAALDHLGVALGAVVGIVLGVTIERRNRFRKIAAHHQAQFRKLVSQGHIVLFAGSSDDPIMRCLERHESMRLKYEHAARYPWLAVHPDPPPPYL